MKGWTLPLSEKKIIYIECAPPCRQFAEACGQALNVNERLIKEDQLEYQEEMRAHYRDMLTELSAVMNEQVWQSGNRWH